MSRHEIKCVNKVNKQNTSKIFSIGGLNPDGSRWRITESRAIEGIESGKWEFYVKNGKREIDVIVVESNTGKYLRTKADNIEENNLLNLPECPL